MEIEKIDLRTPLQKEKAERNKLIYTDYEAILTNLPENATKWAIWRTLGEKYGMKAQGIRTIITKIEN